MALQILDTKENRQRMFEQTLNYVFYESTVKFSCYCMWENYPFLVWIMNFCCIKNTQWLRYCL